MKKILKITGITLVLLVILLALAPFMFKGKIIRMVKDAANENIEAHLDFDESISISLFRNFPQLSITIRDLSVVGKAPFEGDTLFYAETLRTVVNTMSVISGDKIEIKAIDMVSPVINLLINKEGKANWDITKPDDEETPEEEGAPFAMEIQSLSLRDARVIYQDAELDFGVNLKGFNHDLKGDFTLSEFVLKTYSEIESLSMRFDGVEYLSNVASKIKADLNMDMNAFRFTFLQNEILLNELPLQFDGAIQLNDEDMDFDLTFGATQSDFKHFISLIPALYANDFDKIKTSGSLGLNGFFKGKMTDESMPGFGLKLQIENGFFKYPDLPAAVEKVMVDLAIENKSGLDKDFTLDLKKLSLVMDANPFDMNLQMKNLIAPSLKGAMKGKLDLGSVLRLVPLEDTEIKGLLQTDLSFSGTLASMDQGDYESVDAKGHMYIQQLFYKSIDLPEGVSLDKFALEFTPKYVRMDECSGMLGKSDFQLNGQLSNFFSYLFSDGVLKGNLAFQSSFFDANAFLTEDEKTESTTSSTEKTENPTTSDPIEIPTNIDFSLQALIKELQYEKYEIKNMKGNIAIKEGKLFFKETGMELLGGVMSMSGVFDGQNPTRPFTDLVFSMKNFDIPYAFQQMDIMKEYLPLAQKMTGVFSMDLALSSSMDADLNLLYPTLSGKGSIGLSNATISNAKVMEVLADQLKIEKFRKLELKNQRLDFVMQDGKLLTDSFNMPLWDQTKLKLGGFTTLDGKLNYAGFITMPRKELGVASASVDRLLKDAEKRGLTFKMDDVVNIALSISGEATKPIVKINIAETAAGIADNLLQQAKDQIKQKVTDKVDNVKKDITDKVEDTKEEARRKAREEGDKLITQAQTQADRITGEANLQAERIRKEGKEAADRMRREATKQAADLVSKAANPIQKVAAEKAGEKLIKETEEKAVAIEKEAERNAKNIETEAQKRADKIMFDARQKADAMVQAI